VFFYLCKLAIQQTLSPLYNWFYIDFLGAKVELDTVNHSIFSILASLNQEQPLI